MNDHTVTIYNYNKALNSWQRTVLSGVSYSYSLEKTISSAGAIVLNQVQNIVIPFTAKATDNRQYIDATQYTQLADTAGYWTINSKNNLDMVVSGECTQEITSSYKVSQLKIDYQKAGLIKGFQDNTDVTFLKHYKVVAI